MKKTALLLLLSLVLSICLQGCSQNELQGTFSYEVEDGYAIYVFEGNTVIRKYQPKTDAFEPMQIKGKFKYDSGSKELILDFTKASQQQWADFYLEKKQVLTFECFYDETSLTFDGYTYTKLN